MHQPPQDQVLVLVDLGWGGGLSIGARKAAVSQARIGPFEHYLWPIFPLIPALKVTPNLKVGTLPHIPKLVREGWESPTFSLPLTRALFFFFSLLPPHSLNCRCSN